MIDQLLDEFQSAGITRPLTIIEQISFLMFARMLDMREQAAEERARRTGHVNWERIFPEDKQHLRWSHLVNQDGAEQLAIVQGELFEFLKKGVVKSILLDDYLKDAQCVIGKEELLKKQTKPTPRKYRRRMTKRKHNQNV